LVKIRANHKKKLAKLIHPTEAILSKNMAVSFKVPGMNRKINMKLYKAKQHRKAAQTLLSKALEFLLNR